MQMVARGTQVTTAAKLGEPACAACCDIVCDGERFRAAQAHHHLGQGTRQQQSTPRLSLITTLAGKIHYVQRSQR